MGSLEARLDRAVTEQVVEAPQAAAAQMEGWMDSVVGWWEVGDLRVAAEAQMAVREESVVGWWEVPGWRVAAAAHMEDSADPAVG